MAVKLRVSNTEGRANRNDTFVDTEAPFHWRQNQLLSGYNAMSMGIWYWQEHTSNHVWKSMRMKLGASYQQSSSFHLWISTMLCLNLIAKEWWIK